MMKYSIVSVICAGLILLVTRNVFSEAPGDLTTKSSARLNGPVINGYRLTAITNKKVYSAGEHINLLLTVRNMAATNVNVVFGAYFSYFQVDVLGPDGKKVKYTVTI